MKTLDEVITDMENCVYQDCDCSQCPALHYLREYQAEKANLEIIKGNYQDAIANCEKAENKFKTALKKLDIGTLNDPLTWDELKQMEGKPVWMEWTKTEESYWCFVGEWFDDDEMRIYHIGRDYADYIHKTIYSPDIVQAYRKERNENA